MSEPSTYSISDLAEAAQVTPRTIRYYTTEGLLPPPDTRGKYARYSDEHLLRLQLIARLKGAYLPLAEIRTRLAALNADDLPQTVIVPTPLNSAADYLVQVIGIDSQRGTAQIAEPPPSYHSSEASVARAISPPVTTAMLPASQPVRTEHHTHPVEPTYPDSGAIAEQTWRRIILARGVEIHISEPLQPVLRHQIEQLIAFGRTLFKHHPKGDPL